MAWRDWGNPAIYSTTAQPVSNPSTATLVAEIDSTQLGTAHWQAGQKRQCLVTWLVGADTNATWQFERVESTALASTGQVVYVKTPTAQTGQYMTSVTLQKNSRLRVRANSTFTASATASITAEFMT